MINRDSSTPTEELSLFNPAFVAVLEHAVIVGYASRNKNRAIPLALLYLAIPLVLHGPTRRALPTTVASQMAVWTQSHPEFLAGLPDRVRALRTYVNNGILLGLSHGVLLRSDLGQLTTGALKRRPRGFRITREVEECISKANFVGRWLGTQSDDLTALAFWGLRP